MIMNFWSISLLFVLISCCALGVYSKSCVEDNDCHYGRCCERHCVWHHICPCANDNDCRVGEECKAIRTYRYCTIKRVDTPTTFKPKNEADPASKTESLPKESEKYRSKARAWRTRSIIIVISCVITVGALVPLSYLVFRKTRKRRPTNVTVLPRQGPQAGMTGIAMNPLATAGTQMQQGGAAYNGATPMEAGAGPCPYKAPGALPPYYALEFEGELKGKEDPPPGYDEAVKPPDVTTK